MKKALRASHYAHRLENGEDAESITYKTTRKAT